MLETSKTYAELINSENYSVQIEIKVKPSGADSYTRTLHNADIVKFEYNDSCVAGAFSLGATYAKNISFSIKNYDYSENESTFSGARIWLKMGIQDEIFGLPYDSTHAIMLNKGYYNVTKVKREGRTIRIEATDDMIKLDRPYTHAVDASTTEGAGYIRYAEVISGICSLCGVECDTMEFMNYSDYPMHSAYYGQGVWADVHAKTSKIQKGMTCRDAVGYIAQLACGYARFSNTGKLQILSLKGGIPHDFLRTAIDDGGTFTTASTPYSDGDNIEGGNFATYSTDPLYAAEGGSFAEGGGCTYGTYHAINAVYSLDVEPDIYEVDTVFVVDHQYDGDFEWEGTGNVSPYTATSSAHAMKITDNLFVCGTPLATAAAGDIRDYFTRSYSSNGDKQYLSYSCTCQPDFCREAGDRVVISLPTGETYCSLILKYKYEFGKTEELSADFGEPDDHKWNAKEI